MEKFSTKLKSFFIIFAIVFVLFWGLAIFANYALVETLYYILFFPVGTLLFMLGNYFSSHYAMDHWIHDEYLGLFLILVTIIAQTFVYYYIYKFVKARKKRKTEIQ